MRCVAAATVLGGLAVAPTAPADGGLRVTPLRFEGKAVPGALGTLRVTNGSSRPVSVTVTARRWRQLPDGQIMPDQSPTGIIRGVSVSSPQFMLGAGSTQSVDVGLRVVAHPYLYGALVTTAMAVDDAGLPLRHAYAIASTIHLAPPASAQRVALKPGGLRTGASSGGLAITLPVHNFGNLISRVGAVMVVQGPGGTRNVAAAPQLVLPGFTVNLVGRLSAHLRPGAYAVRAWLARPTSKHAPTRVLHGSFVITSAGAVQR